MPSNYKDALGRELDDVFDPIHPSVTPAADTDIHVMRDIPGEWQKGIFDVYPNPAVGFRGMHCDTATGRIIALGHAVSELWISTDARNWEHKSFVADGMAPPGACFNVFYGDSKWVVVGGQGYIQWSTDQGQSWNYTQASTQKQFTSVHYGNGMWMAVGFGGPTGNPWVSVNGENWTELTTWNPVWTKQGGLHYAEGIWATSRYYTSTQMIIMKSSDNGVTWDSGPIVTIGEFSGQALDIKHDDEHNVWAFSTSAYDGSGAGGRTNKLFFSEDNMVTTSAEVTLSFQAITLAYVGNDYWVINGDRMCHYDRTLNIISIWQATDNTKLDFGATWGGGPIYCTYADLGPDNKYIIVNPGAVTTGGIKFIGVNDYFGTQRGQDLSERYYPLTAGGTPEATPTGITVPGGADLNTLYAAFGTSPQHWSDVNVDIPVDYFTCVNYSPDANLWVAAARVGAGNYYMYTSVDGINWIQRNSIGDMVVRDIHQSETGNWIAVGMSRDLGNDGHTIYSLDDAITWQQATYSSGSPDGGTHVQCRASHDTYMTGGKHTDVWMDTDNTGAVWVEEHDVTPHLFAVHTNGVNWVMIEENSDVHISNVVSPHPNTNDWTELNNRWSNGVTDNDDRAQDMTYINGVWVIVGGSGQHNNDHNILYGDDTHVIEPGVSLDATPTIPASSLIYTNDDDFATAVVPSDTGVTKADICLFTDLKDEGGKLYASFIPRPGSGLETSGGIYTSVDDGVNWSLELDAGFTPNFIGVSSTMIVGVDAANTGAMKYILK